MNKKEIAQAEELIDSVRRGDPPRMVEAVFPVCSHLNDNPDGFCETCGDGPHKEN